MNNQYTKAHNDKVSSTFKRIDNNKLIISIAKTNPKYIESSDDRPNFYNEYDYDKWLRDNPETTKEEFVDLNISNYEYSLELTQIKSNAIKQAYMINNDELVFSIVPETLASQLGIEVKDVFNLIYLKVVMVDTNETKYFWIGNMRNNEDRRKSITFFCAMDYWTTYYKSVVFKMQGNPIVLRKHFNRFKEQKDYTKPLEFNFDYSSPVHNIDGAYSSLPKNITSINGITRPNNNAFDGSNYSTNNFDIDYGIITDRLVLFSSYGATGTKLSTITNSTTSLNSFFSNLELNNYIVNTTQDTLNFSRVYGPKEIASTGKLSDDFVYTFQYNIHKDTDANNVDATYGIQVFDKAQTNNQYEPEIIPNPDPSKDPITVYNKTILNRVGNIINNKINNKDDLPNNNGVIGNINVKNWEIDLINPSLSTLSFVVLKKESLAKVREYRKVNPYIASSGVSYIDELGNKKNMTNGVIWSLGSFYITWDGKISNSLRPLFLIDIKGEIKNIKLNIKETNSTDFFASWEVEYKDNSFVGKTDFTAKEFNDDNYSELVEGFNIKVEGYDWTNQVNVYEDGADWDFAREPQVYMSHCFQRELNYLGATKGIPFELFGNDYKMYLNQLITPSTAIDNIYITSKNIKARLTLSNGGIKTEYNNAKPSVSDSFKAYMQQNASQLNNSYLTAQGNLQYQKQQMGANVGLSTISLAGSLAGLGLSLKKGAGKYVNKDYTNDMSGIEKYLGDLEKGNTKVKLPSSHNALQNLGFASAIGSSFAGLTKSIVNGQKNIFNAEQGIKQIEAFVSDAYNKPDEMIYSSSSIQDIENYYDNINKLFENNIENNGIIRALEIQKLPLINKVKEYSMDTNKSGYIANIMLFNQNLDTLISRDRFNFIQLGDIQNMFKDITINSEVKNYFMNMFEGGVRLWNTKYDMLDYSKENWELSIIEGATWLDIEPIPVSEEVMKQVISNLDALDKTDPAYRLKVMIELRKVFSGVDVGYFEIYYGLSFSVFTNDITLNALKSYRFIGGNKLLVSIII